MEYNRSVHSELGQAPLQRYLHHRDVGSRDLLRALLSDPALASGARLEFCPIARELNLDEETVAKWARAKNYTKGGGKTLVRKSKLEPYKIIIQRWLERHSYTATQIFP